MNRKLLSLLLCLILVWGAAAAYAAEDLTDLNLVDQELLDAVKNANGISTIDTNGDGFLDGNDTVLLEEIIESPGTVTENVYTAGAEVKVKLADLEEHFEEKKYNVEIVWGSMVFGWGVVTDEGVNVWNPDEHTYTVTTPDGDQLDPYWYLLSDEPLVMDYMPDETIDGGVDYVTNEKGITTTQAHVLVFNHSNRPVLIAAELKDEADSVNPLIHPLEDEEVAVLEGYVADPDGNAYPTTEYRTATKTVPAGEVYDGVEREGYTTCLFDLAKGVEKDRYDPTTSAVMTVELTTAPTTDLATKTKVATLTVTLAEEGRRGVEPTPPAEDGGEIGG